jgi:hypothetical protein
MPCVGKEINSKLAVLFAVKIRIMKEYQDYKRASLQSFKLSLKSHGYVSLCSLATWNNNFPKEKDASLSPKRTHTLLISGPKTDE